MLLLLIKVLQVVDTAGAFLLEDEEALASRLLLLMMGCADASCRTGTELSTQFEVKADSRGVELNEGIQFEL